MKRPSLFALCCSVALAACGGSSVSTPRDGATDALDVTAPADALDVTAPVDALDVTAPADAPDVTAPADAPDVAPPVDGFTDAPTPRDDGPSGRCSTQAECADDPMGHVCDPATGRCVPCTESSRAACMATEYCTAAHRCEVGCGADADCAGDGGLTRCDLVRHVCARCGSDDHCPAGLVCQGGTCAPGCTVTHPCSVGQSCCAGACLDLNADASHCGTCSTVCSVGDNATATCLMGACGIACAPGFADCDGNRLNGCEASLTATASCGRCGVACSGSTPVCSTSGACVSGCAATLARCGMTCEDTQTSVDHCGGCGRPCPEAARAVRRCAAGVCAFTCETGYGDCDGGASNGCEASLQTSALHCGACGRSCAPGLECRGGSCAAFQTTCKGILDAGLSTGDGVYTVLLGGTATPIRCLMTVDGGGWTLVGNFPNPGSTAGVAGWSSGARVGASFTDLSRAFKLSDAEINAMRTTGFRANGRATMCVSGPCSIDTTLYWRATCEYASGSNSPACSTAFRDVGYTLPESVSAPCSWHWGLTASNCSSTATMGTSHVGEHVFVGDYGSYVHAFDGRSGENPSVQFWVR